MRRVLIPLLVVGFALTGCSAEPAAPSSTSSSTTTTVTTTTMVRMTTTTARPRLPEPVVENLGLAVSWLVQLADGVALGVDESGQGTDLSGDGDTEDTVVHVVTEAGVVGTGLESEWPVAAIPGGGFVVQVWEEAVGADLNGDGDLDDNVPQLWDAAGGVANLGIDAWATSGPDGSLWLGSVMRGRTLQVLRPDGELVDTGWIVGSVVARDDGTALLGVFERDRGVDLDGDGTSTGHVAVLWEAGQPAVVIGPAYVFGSTADGGAWLSWDERDETGSLLSWHLGFWHPDREFDDLPIATVNHTAMPDGGLILGVSETMDYWSYSYECVPGSSDLNGDGDCDDVVLHRWSPTTGLVSFGLSRSGWYPEADWGYVMVGELAYVSQGESEIGRDLDGDGEVTGAFVLHLVEGDAVENLGLRVTWGTSGWAPFNGGVVVLVEEVAEDLDADGDASDAVFHIVSSSGTVTNLGLAGRWAQPLDGGEVVLLAEESTNGRDLNGDGHISNDAYVIHVLNPQRGLVNTGITNSYRVDEEEGGWSPNRVGILPDSRIVALVPEQQHGRGDLNGDGDTDDEVAQVISK